MMTCTNCGNSTADPAAAACPYCRMSGTLQRKLPGANTPNRPESPPGNTNCRNCGHSLDSSADGKCPVCRFPVPTGANRRTGPAAQHGLHVPANGSLILQTRFFN